MFLSIHSWLFFFLFINKILFLHLQLLLSYLQAQVADSNSRYLEHSLRYTIQNAAHQHSHLSTLARLDGHGGIRREGARRPGRR